MKRSILGSISSFSLPRLVFRMLVVLLIGLVFVAACGVYRDSEDAALASCVLSVEDALSTNLRKPPLSERIPLTAEWRPLSDDETNMLFNSLDKSRGYDCANQKSIARGESNDGSHLQLSARLTNGVAQVALVNFKDIKYIDERRYK